MKKTDEQLQQEVAKIRRFIDGDSADKIVQQLASVSFERYGNGGMGGELVVNLDDAIEIVRGGLK